jgi:hypothetical protein
LTRKMGRAAMVRVQGKFAFARMLDEYRALMFPAEGRSMPGVRLEPSHGNLELITSELD